MRVARAFAEQVLDREASTRSYGLLRVGLAAIVWAEYGSRFSLWADHAPARQVFAVGMLAVSALMLVGLWSRLTTGLTAAGLVVAYHYFGVYLGMKGPFVHAHSYLLMSAVVLLALAPNGRSLSLDRWRRLAKRSALPELGPVWPLVLVRLQVALVYFWGAVDKTNVAFLSGSRLQQMAWYYFGSHEGMRAPLLDEVLVLGGIGTVVLEYALAFGLWFAPSRRWLVPLGALFHFAIFASVPVGTFSVLTVFLYLAFPDPDAVHRDLEEMVSDPG